MKKCCFFFIYKCFAFVNFGVETLGFFFIIYTVTLYYQEVKVYDDIDLSHGDEEAKKDQKLVFFIWTRFRLLKLSTK